MHWTSRHKLFNGECIIGEYMDKKNRLVVFDGEPAEYGLVKGPFDMKEGMNLFLEDLQITFRRDQESFRPRINKPDSQKDREQKEKGELYYS